MNQSRPKVSVVVPMRNEEKHIDQCLSALASQDYPVEHMEILVVDGMSDDRSRRRCERLVARVSSYSSCWRMRKEEPLRDLTLVSRLLR